MSISAPPGTNTPSPAPLAALANSAQRASAGSVATSLHRMQRWLDDDLSAVRKAIESGVDLESLLVEEPAQQAAAYALRDTGKLVRPLCVLLAARMAGRTLDREVLDLAVAAELVHTATLLHDDVIDLGERRRGVPAARVVFGNAAAVLGGDHLLIAALRRVAPVGNAEIMNTLLTTISSMVAAEAGQLEARGSFEPDREQYFDVIAGKTGALFRWSLSAGGRLGGLDEESVAALDAAGFHLGVAFQLVDDILDIVGERVFGDADDDGVLSKSLLTDVREGKMTWPLILLSERDAEGAALLERTAARGTVTAQEHAELYRRLSEQNCISDSVAFANEHADLCRQALSALPDGEARSAFSTIVAAVVSRADAAPALEVRS